MISILAVTAEENIAHIRTLFREYQTAFLAEVAFQRCLSLQNVEAELAALPSGYAPPQGALLLATYDGAPAGCVALKSLGEGICALKRLYVKPEYRDLKLGRTLVAAIIEKAQALGYRCMRLDTPASMKRAQSLYRSFGFREIAPYCGSPVSDAVYLELSL